MVQKRKGLIHVSFEIGLLIKGIDGILEVLGSILLLLVSPNQVHKIIAKITRHELSEDPNDFIAKLLLSLSNRYSVSVQFFSAFYLLSHGIIKLIVIYLLRRRKYWAYPLSIVFFLLFIVYQTYRFFNTHAIWLIILTIFDLLMIYLTYKEYRNIQDSSK
jgi:uncharacterized membrane protein